LAYCSKFQKAQHVARCGRSPHRLFQVSLEESVPRLMFTQGIAIAALFCATLPPAASAEEQKYPTKIIATPLSPVTLTNCYGVKDAIGVIYVTNSLINRKLTLLNGLRRSLVCVR